MTIELNQTSFDQEVTAGKIPVIVDFWAPWCGPCRSFGPTIEDIAHDFEGKVKVAKVNVDENQQLAVRFGVMSIPTLAFFRDGRLVKTQVGAMQKQALAQQIHDLLLSAG